LSYIPDSDGSPRPPSRGSQQEMIMFYGLDVHKEFIQVCVLNAKGTKREEYRVGGSAEEVEAFAKKLQPSDQVVLEATFHT